MKSPLPVNDLPPVIRPATPDKKTAVTAKNLLERVRHGRKLGAKHLRVYPCPHASFRGGKGKPRELTVTTLYRGAGSGPVAEQVPYLRVSGRWLAQLGFARGSRVIISGEPGRLVLTLASHPAAADTPSARN